MAITDELREWWVRKFPIMDKELHEDFTAIAKRIDAEHQKACNDAWDNGYEADYLGIENWLIEHQQVMENHGWVKLPKDADGEPIRIGDMMKGEKIGGGFCEPFEVVGYIMSNGELEPMDEHKCPRSHKYLHHHKQPTVEDVLRQFLGECESAQNLGYDEVPQEVFAEYAKRLKLAGEGDE